MVTQIRGGGPGVPSTTSSDGKITNYTVVDEQVQSYEDNVAGMACAIPHGKYKNLSVTGSVTGQAEEGALVGFYVNSTNAGTLVLADGGPSGTAITGIITPAIGWHFLPAQFNKSGGLYATIGGTALDVTFIYRAG